MAGFTIALAKTDAHFNFRLLVLVVLCMVFARSAAMAFNRFIDRRFDAKNPRTAMREIPAGTISPAAALAMVIASSLAFITCTAFINELCLYLSPVALTVILGYSYTKRFTALCHIVLGLGLGLAPIGSYIAVTGEFAVLPVLLSILVFFWVSGFDIIYALQDDDFDRSQGLNSIPVLLGRSKALSLSRFFHVIVSSLVVLIFLYGQFGIWYLIGAVLFVGLLIYQHYLVKPNDLSRVNLAFATTNGVGSVVFCSFLIVDVLF